MSIEKGGYLIKESTDSQITLVASGSELQLILDASENLEKESWRNFKCSFYAKFRCIS